MCQNTTIRVYGAWIKIYYVLCSKHMPALAMCYNPPLVRDKPPGAPAFVKIIYDPGQVILQGGRNVFVLMIFFDRVSRVYFLYSKIKHCIETDSQCEHRMSIQVSHFRLSVWRSRLTVIYSPFSRISIECLHRQNYYCVSWASIH